MSLSSTQNNSDKRPISSETWGSLWLVLVVWLISYLWGIIYWISWYSYNNIEISWLHVAGLGLLDWSFWLFATPLTLWVARHYPPVQPRSVLWVHLPLSLFCCVGAMALSSWVRIIFEPVDQAPFMTMLETRLYSEGNWYFLFYWFVVGAYFSVDYHAAYRKRTLESLQLQLNNENLQRRLIEARLTTLKVQLQPHFLFNALHSVSSLMESSVPRARGMLIELAELLRLALKISERDTHPLEDEFDWLEKYLSLEAVRLTQGLRWNLSLSVDVENEQVPCLLIQPMVENAIKHDHKANRETVDKPLEINISAYAKHGNVIIEVNDNGPGIGCDGWEEGYGLRFVRESIEAHTQQQAMVMLTNREVGGVSVSVEWPLGD